MSAKRKYQEEHKKQWKSTMKYMIGLNHTHCIQSRYFISVWIIIISVLYTFSFTRLEDLKSFVAAIGDGGDGCGEIAFSTDHYLKKFLFVNLIGN